MYLNLESFLKLSFTFNMDVAENKIKKETKVIIAKEENIDNEEPNSEYEDNVPDWIAKAYGSKLEKKSFYDPGEVVSCYQ